MIKPGWKRDVCPQCHMPGLVHRDRILPVLRSRKPNTESPGLFIDYSTCQAYLMQIGIHELKWNIHVDVCDNCGILYAYECIGAEEESTKSG